MGLPVTADEADGSWRVQNAAGAVYDSDPPQGGFFHGPP